jgi:hypothetical protein
MRIRLLPPEVLVSVDADTVVCIERRMYRHDSAPVVTSR